MKNTIRVRHNHGSKPAVPQGEKPSILGQNSTLIGLSKTEFCPKKHRKYQKVSLVIKMDKSHVRSLKALAAATGMQVPLFCVSALLTKMDEACEALGLGKHFWIEHELSKAQVKTLRRRSKLLWQLPLGYSGKTN